MQAIINTKNCPLIKINKEMAKKAGLNIDPKFVCSEDTTIFPRIVKEFGMDACMHASNRQQVGSVRTA